MIVESVPNVSLLVALGAQRERDGTDRSRIRCYCSQRVVVSEGETVGCRRYQRAGELFVGRSSTDLTSEPPEIIQLELRVLNAPKIPERCAYL